MSLDQASFSYPVSWSDFIDKSSRPAGEDEDAYIKVRFPFSYDFGRVGNAIKITSVDMKLEVTGESWAVSSQETNDLLKHKQGHYDINAIGAREGNYIISCSRRCWCSVRSPLLCLVTNNRSRWQWP